MLPVALRIRSKTYDSSRGSASPGDRGIRFLQEQGPLDEPSIPGTHTKDGLHALLRQSGCVFALKLLGRPDGLI